MNYANDNNKYPRFEEAVQAVFKCHDLREKPWRTITLWFRGACNRFNKWREQDNLLWYVHFMNAWRDVEIENRRKEIKEIEN